MTEEVTQQEPQEPTQPQEAAELTISDLAAMKMIVDIASQRGAFKPNEMMLVGQTYTKLATFLDTVSKQSKQGA